MKSRDFIGIKVFGGRSQINQGRKRVKMEQIQCLRSFFPGGLRRLLTTSSERIYRHANSNISKIINKHSTRWKFISTFLSHFYEFSSSAMNFTVFYLKFIFIALKIPLGRAKRNRREEFNFIKFISHICVPHFHETFLFRFVPLCCLLIALNVDEILSKVAISYFRFFRDFFTNKKPAEP